MEKIKEEVQEAQEAIQVYSSRKMQQKYKAEQLRKEIGKPTDYMEQIHEI